VLKYLFHSNIIIIIICLHFIVVNKQIMKDLHGLAHFSKGIYMLFNMIKKRGVGYDDVYKYLVYITLTCYFI
jgi:hypothetical protein